VLFRWVTNEIKWPNHSGPVAIYEKENLCSLVALAMTVFFKLLVINLIHAMIYSLGYENFHLRLCINKMKEMLSFEFIWTYRILILGQVVDFERERASLLWNWMPMVSQSNIKHFDYIMEPLPIEIFTFITILVFEMYIDWISMWILSKSPYQGVGVWDTQVIVLAVCRIQICTSYCVFPFSMMMRNLSNIQD